MPDPNPGRTHFFTACFEMQGTTGGLEREHLFGRAHTDWGNFCAALAREGSFIRTVQQVSRVVPDDTADHSMWIASRIPAGTDPALVASYIALLDTAAVTREQHRTWLVLRLPVTAAFFPLGAEPGRRRRRRAAPGGPGGHLGHGPGRAVRHGCGAVGVTYAASGMTPSA